ncbi:hypothetical protein J6590_040365 [Homalodisca vitripennis]|nr:hypothetical protein J6590_040365 [Homalodisca vitripennis]
MAGDMVKCLCGSCNKTVQDRHHALLCEGICGKRWHINCANINKKQFEVFKEIEDMQGLKWYCPKCLTKVTCTELRTLDDHLLLQHTQDSSALISIITSELENITKNNLVISERLTQLASESEVMKIQLNEVVQNNCNQQISKESSSVESYSSVLVNGSVGGSNSPLPTRYVSDGTVQATSSQSRTATPCAESSSTDSGDFRGFDSAVTLDGLNRNNMWNTVVAKKNRKLKISSENFELNKKIDNVSSENSRLSEEVVMLKQVISEFGTKPRPTSTLSKPSSNEAGQIENYAPKAGPSENVEGTIEDDDSVQQNSNRVFTNSNRGWKTANYRGGKSGNNMRGNMDKSKPNVRHIFATEHKTKELVHRPKYGEATISHFGPPK